MLPYITSIVHLFTYRTYDYFRNQHKQISVTIKQYAKIHRDVARILSLGGLKPMVSAECEPIMGVWGQSPSGIQGQCPW